MDSITWMAAVQVRCHSLLLYYYPDRPLTHKRKLPTDTYTGKVSASTQKRIRRTVDILLQKSPQQTVWNPITHRPNTFRLTFLTLTISAREIVPHREANRKGLQPFLDWLRRRGVKSYIWKAELQQRGQVHYHITTNKFLRFDSVRDEWNRIQKRAGWLDGYRERTGHENPNSTDIHAVQKIQRLDLYIAKYISKTDATGTIDGKVWGCSSDLMGAKYFSCDLSEFTENCLKKAVADGTVKQVRMERCTIFDTPNPTQFLDGNHNINYRNWAQK